MTDNSIMNENSNGNSIETAKSTEEQMRAISELFYLDSRRYSQGLGGEE